jgi:hypothetical protein
VAEVGGATYGLMDLSRTSVLQSSVLVPTTSCIDCVLPQLRERTFLTRPLPPERLGPRRGAHCQYVIGAQRNQNSRSKIRQEGVVQQELPGGGAIEGCNLLHSMPNMDDVGLARVLEKFARVGRGRKAERI